MRSGLISQDDYFGMLGKVIGGVQRGSGRLKQTVAESSFDAWVKYYRQDENAPNAIVSYYTKGSLVALAFDLTIRAQTNNRKSLDDVMRLLWQRFGRDFYRGKPVGVDESEIEAIFAEATGGNWPTVRRSRAWHARSAARHAARAVRVESRPNWRKTGSRRLARACAAARIARWRRFTKAAPRKKPDSGRRRADRARRPARNRLES